MVEEMVKVMRSNLEAEIHFKGIGLLLYHMSKKGIHDATIIKRFEQNLFKYKDLFNHRLAFGAYYGVIRMNLDNFYMLEFLEKEIRRFAGELTIEEAIELTEAIAENTVQTKEYLFMIIDELIKPILLASHKHRIK